MPTTKRHVLAEIKRLAEANGSPPGVRLFERESGIKESEWFPALWLRWGDALQEAGFSRNKMVQAVGDEVLLEQYALLAQKLSRLPLQGELIRESKANPTFPSRLLGRTIEYFSSSHERSHLLCAVGMSSLPKGTPCYALLWEGVIGAFYKIGRTNNTIRREGEIDIELPHGAEPLHVITTDDAAGIENYWHRRFAAKRLKEEWFALSADDVRAFKRWRKIL